MSQILPTVTTISTRTVVADVTAQTAADTLRHELGLGDRLVGLDRQDVWRLSIDGDQAAALALTERLARETKIFVNPNKHQSRVAQAGRAASSPQPVPAGEGVQSVGFSVAFRGETAGEVALSHLRALYPWAGAVEAVHLETHWNLRVRGTAAEATSIAEQVVVANHADQGLFANPHSQEVRYDAPAI